MKILGVDPGAAGALALLEDGKLIEVVDMPSAKGIVTAKLVNRIALDWSPDRVIVEDVHSFPGQGVASTFKFGRAFGTVIGALHDYLVEFVSPQKWKKHHQLSGKSKDASRLLAIRKWPHMTEEFKLKKHVDRADASLIALWRWEVQ